MKTIFYPIFAVSVASVLWLGAAWGHQPVVTVESAPGHHLTRAIPTEVATADASSVEVRDYGYNR